ncbi:MAG: sigma-54 dependent transcriptional regulator [Pseudomonadota bacterium]
MTPTSRPDPSAPRDARPPSRVLVVDDEESLRHMLRLILERAGYEAITAQDGEDALRVLEREPDVWVVLCDLRMPRLDGLGLLRELRRRHPGLLVIMMSAYGSTDTAIEAVKQGAYDFVSKPFRPDEIVITLRKLEERERLARENERLRTEIAERRASERLVGAGQGLRPVVALAAKVALAPVTVLITGESGTGKEVLARAIHAWSPRDREPFVAVNCGAIPEALLESELFGHERGAFTGAVRQHPGLFEQAHGGTLLLDEIGEMPSALQVKLLRALEERSVRRIGGAGDIPVDVRIIAATARELPELVAAGRFREDLYYRLNVVRLQLPPLRERPEDIHLLVEHFLDLHARRQGRPPPRISAEALQVLEACEWPGNVRQLENACERAVLLAEGGVVRPADLPPELSAEVGASWGGAELADGDLSIKRHQAIMERELIARAMARTGGNRSQAARLLEISYKAIVYKIRDYGLEEG